MKAIGRATLCLGLLTAGVAAQAGLEKLGAIERPPLRRPLASLPLSLGAWSGRDLTIDPHILSESQATEYVSRSYESAKFPGVVLSVWINYSVIGDNMRHSPKICLPSQAWEEVESQTKVLPLDGPGGAKVPATRLVYQQGELFQGIGFWYYIFGEGAIERWVRGLPVTSRSSHGRTTRGSGLTVEVFWPGEGDPDSAAFRDFAEALLAGIDPILPLDRAGYHVP